MNNIGIIQGSAAQAVPVVVNIDTVYVHTDIKKLDTDHLGNPIDNLYQYHEVQYTKDEYVQLLSNENIALKIQQQRTEINVTEMEINNMIRDIQLTDVEIAILELQERIGE